MSAIPTDGWALVALAAVLGAKHGLDADHLVAIDGLTRHNATVRPGLARWCGLLFSLGHGLVVLAVAGLVGLMADRIAIPEWIGNLGAWLSIAFLGALGLLNLAAVLQTPAERVVRTVAVKGRLLTGVMRTSRPWAIALVGALFALSFDTLSQAALVALTATQLSGRALSLALGFAFLVGMMLADGLNGLWMAAMLARADRKARIASRVMGLAVAGLSLGMAAYGAAKHLSPSLEAWYEGRELALGLAVVAAVATAFVVGMTLARLAPDVARSNEG